VTDGILMSGPRWLSCLAIFALSTGTTRSDDAASLCSAAAGTSSPSLIQTAWFRGKWHGRHHLLWQSPKQGKAENPLLLTWSMHDEAAVNVSEVQAVEAAGPLTLLRALAHAGQNEKSALSAALAVVRTRGELRLHLLGVNFNLEPQMAWENFLVGPLTPEQRHLVEAFDLPVTPFSGMKVKVVFSGMGDQAENDAILADLGGIRGSVLNSYHEEFRYGFYHEAVNEPADIAMSLNPGLAHYPMLWYTSISRLRRQGVPFIVTGAGNQVERIYEYDRHFVPEFHGHSLHLQSNSLRRVQKSHEDFLAPIFPGFEKAGEEPNPRTVEKYQDSEGHALLVRYMSRRESAHLGLSQSSASEICSDAGGNRYMAGRAGYIVSSSSKNPFVFCDDHHPLYCNSNGVVQLLEPSRNLAEQPSYMPPPGFFGEVLSEYAKCYPHRHQSCLRRQLSAAMSAPGGLTTELVDEIFNSAISACGL